MRIKSPLTDITDILGQVRESAKLYNDTLQMNESATRAVLIDPILRILGWDTGNPFMVEVEKQIDQGRVDYALIDYNEDIQIIIEAKKLGTDLSGKDTFLSLVKYAFSSGVKDIFLTNGIDWHHFTDFEPGKQDPTKILSLEGDDLVEIAGYLVQRLDAAKYWPEGKDVDELSQNINQLKSEVSGLQLELIKLKSKNLSDDFSREEVDLAAVKLQGSVDLPKNKFKELKNVGNATGTKPKELLLPDGTVVSVKTWTEVLTHCCNFSMEKNPNISIPFKDAAGKKVNLLSSIRPARGITYYEVEYRNQPIYVYTNYDSNNCIRNSLYILQQVPDEQRPSQVSVIYE